MRSRSNSGVRLDYYQRMVQKTILQYQHPVSGLLPASPNHPHAWVRDNVYSVLCVWGLALAYKKNIDLDEDRAKAYELQQSVVKLMRGLLFAMMKQLSKVERFKLSQEKESALHAKYSVGTGDTVVGDQEWGHLQLDATSLFLLILAEMTASGLTIIYDLDEVAFIQNLVFYIQSAYRTPDYGIWERGDKNNHGVTELNMTSIGMAKAALEAMNDLDLFGARGGPCSVIHVMPDEAMQCQAIIQSVLPRESNSKETDAGLLSIISYPAFAVDDPLLIENTREIIIEKLQGRYGLRRFLRDGYKTAKEDPNRLHYWPSELANFENIECEWPCFFCYLMLDAIFTGHIDTAREYSKLLDNVMVKMDDGTKVLPELYIVPSDKVDAEQANPGSQDRVPGGKLPHMWGQSLYILAELLLQGFLSPGELDPLNRRLTAEARPDIAVQVVIVAENREIQAKLAEHHFEVQTVEDIQPIQVHAASVLAKLLNYLGQSDKLSLSGRPSDSVGVLATSKVYTLGDKTLAFYPQMVDNQQFYLSLDPHLFVDIFKAELQYVSSNWSFVGRPTLIFPVQKTILERKVLPHRPRDVHESIHPALIATIRKLQSGYLSGARVKLGKLTDFISTSCITDLTFLTENDSSPGLSVLLTMIDEFSLKAKMKTTSFLHVDSVSRHGSQSEVSGRCRRRSTVRGLVKRSLSIQVDPLDPGRANRRGSEPAYWETISRKSSRSSRTSSTCSSDRNLTLVNSTADMYGYTNTPRPSITDSITIRVEDRDVDSVLLEDPPEAVNIQPAEPVPPSPGIVTNRPPRFGTGHPHLRGQSLSEDPDEFYDFDDNSQFKGVSDQELIQQLSESNELHEQADIIHFLMITKGADWDTGIGGKACTVKELLVELYDKAGHAKQWFLVRHTAGMLKKQVEDLAKAATDIIVRQKQLAIGLPPEPREKIILRPLNPDDLSRLIRESHQEDMTTAMLTQEVLIYLAMFIRTEPKLFNEMLRIRVGLIIQVMASELSRCLDVSGEDASDQLLNLSPYEMKTLLHHILSGKEFTVKANVSLYNEETRLTVEPVEVKSRPASRYSKKKDAARNSAKKVVMERLHSQLGKEEDDLQAIQHIEGNLSQRLNQESDRSGQWLRRRRLDGALNRVPIHFYQSLWNVLQRCPGLSIEGSFLPQNLTREMTPGEFKFALQLEMALNKVPQPEYRQLLVEAMITLISVCDHDAGKSQFNNIIHVEQVVHAANDIFIKEQSQLDGDVTMCCGMPDMPRGNPLRCAGTAQICIHFYDTAPSGRYGTLAYLTRALLMTLNFPTEIDGNLDCCVS